MALPSLLHDMTGLGCAGLSGGVRSPLRRSTEAVQGRPRAKNAASRPPSIMNRVALGPDQVKHSLQLATQAGHWVYPIGEAKSRANR
jgi:hypothetical protein